MFSTGGSIFLGAIAVLVFLTAAADLWGGDRFSDGYPFDGRLSWWLWAVVVGHSMEVTFNGGDSGGVGVAVGFAPQLHESAGGLPKTKLVSHSCSLAGSTNAMEVSIPIASAMKVSNWGGHLHFCKVGE
ncbi:hypothetical protein Tco_0375528 [Tanacetum coccineum]